MIRTPGIWVVVGVLLASAMEVAADQGFTPATRISRDLSILGGQRAAPARAGVSGTFVELPLTDAGGWVAIDAIAADDPSALEAELTALGARDTAIAAGLVSARIPVAAIPKLENLASLQFARPAYRIHNVGKVTSQGDHVMRADQARQTFGFDGTGVTVGVISDSFNCLGGAPADVASGDLPVVAVLKEDPACPWGTDEGRAMLQIVHDVAPGASLAFATGEGGQAGFANNIRALRNAGAKVIVDDLIYLAEPMFQDGVIAQAVDEVVGSGVAYFSAAGNNARNAYDHAFVPGVYIAPQAGIFRGGIAHRFSPGNTLGSFLQTVSVPAGSAFILMLQWDSPFYSVSGPPGTQNDLDVYLLVRDPVSGYDLATWGTTDNTVSKDPVESLAAQCNAPAPSQCVGYLLIVNRAGTNPGRFKYVLYSYGGRPSLSPATSSGTIYGHANAQGAVAVGAANYRTPTVLESFSSGGTTPVLFDIDGNLLGTPDPRQFKPEIVAPDGVDTTFFGSADTDQTGFLNFFGTSAAAPHAAGVAALLLQAPLAQPLTPAQVRNTLENTAQNMGPPGFDSNTGFGFIRADSALDALHVLSITTGPSGAANPANPGGLVSLSVTAGDTFGHALTYAWTSTCAGGLLPGSFSNATLVTTTWTAPANATGASQNCALKVTVSDGHGLSKSGTWTETVRSVARVTSVAPAAAPVGATIVISGKSLTDTSLVTFGGAVSAAPLPPVTATSLKVVVPAGALTGKLSLTTPVGVGVSGMVFKVQPKITGSTPSSVVAQSDSVVVVTGTNLRAATGEPMVKVGAFPIPPASVVSSTITELQFRVPLGPVTGKISVTTVDGTTVSATNLTVIQPPVATAFVPAAAPVGATVTVKGTNMTGTTQMTFAGAGPVAPLAPGTAASLKVIVPPDALTGSVSITNAIGTGTGKAIFKVLPKISSFNVAAGTDPSSVLAGSGDIVQVFGTSLRAAKGEPTVKVGPFAIPPASIVKSTLTELDFRMPMGPVTGKISVTTVDGTTVSATNLTVIQPARATAFVPGAGPVGATITIKGTNMAVANQMTVAGSVAPVTPTPVNAISLTVSVPADALTGPVTIQSAANGEVASVTSKAIFKVLPKITAFSPSSVVAGSATLVVVSGTSLRVNDRDPTVKVGAVKIPTTSLVLSTPTELHFTVPAGAKTGKISVTTMDGTAVSTATLTVN